MEGRPDLSIVDAIEASFVSIVFYSYARHEIAFCIPQPDYEHMWPFPLVSNGQLGKHCADLQ